MSPESIFSFSRDTIREKGNRNTHRLLYNRGSEKDIYPIIMPRARR